MTNRQILTKSYACRAEGCYTEGDHYHTFSGRVYDVTPTNPDPYENFLEVAKALDDAEVPTDGRVMCYYVWSWWRHPIKRWRQKRALKYLGENLPK